MESVKKVKTVGAVAVGGAVAVITVLEPTSLAAKCACVLVGGILGAVIADPLQKEIAHQKERIAGLNAAVEVLANRVVHLGSAA